jgi:hypothetical protein
MHMVVRMGLSPWHRFSVDGAPLLDPLLPAPHQLIKVRGIAVLLYVVPTLEGKISLSGNSYREEYQVFLLAYSYGLDPTPSPPPTRPCTCYKERRKTAREERRGSDCRWSQLAWGGEGPKEDDSKQTLWPLLIYSLCDHYPQPELLRVRVRWACNKQYWPCSNTEPS